MDGSAGTVLVAFSALVVLGLLVAEVIAWFGYRRQGWAVDHRAIGLGFTVAGLIALTILLVTEGPWVVGAATIGAGAIHLGRARMDRSR